MAKISKTLDEAVAWNLDHHVMGTNMFILARYENIAKRLLRRLRILDAELCVFFPRRRSLQQ